MNLSDIGRIVIAVIPATLMVYAISLLVGMRALPTEVRIKRSYRVLSVMILLVSFLVIVQSVVAHSR
jgi:hypothetical protein